MFFSSVQIAARTEQEKLSYDKSRPVLTKVEINSLLEYSMDYFIICVTCVYCDIE